jgi:hypothetical protein
MAIELVLSILSLINDAVAATEDNAKRHGAAAMSEEWMRVWKWLWYISRYYLDIYLTRLGHPQNSSVTVTVKLRFEPDISRIQT